MSGAKRPKMFESRKSIQLSMQILGDNLVAGTLDAGMEAVKSGQPEDVEVKRKPTYLEITNTRLEKLGVIDLKKSFARSPHRKIKEGGGWYLTVPIAIKTRAMSSRMYKQLRETNIAPSRQQTVVSDYMYDRRRQSDSSMLNYTPKSHNVTKKQEGNKRHTYTAYRTVSDKSPANSWIINRDRVTTENTSKTFVKNVDRLMKWKMKHGWR